MPPNFEILIVVYQSVLEVMLQRLQNNNPQLSRTYRQKLTSVKYYFEFETVSLIAI